MESAPIRKIIHVDMDAFYASVEQRDNPELRGKPVAVGGSSKRGVVAAASYEARKFGVRSAMPSITAQRRCPDIVFVKPRFEVYKEVSRQIRSVFFQFTDLVEPLSLDEAYLDVTDPLRGGPHATAIAREIKAQILQETGLTSSAGVSFNKFLAKVASGMNKPDGLTVVRPDQVEQFIDRLPIEKFFGVGKVTARKFRNMGIRNGADLKQRDKMDLERSFGKAGRYYYHICRGEDNRPVRTSRRRKSIGAERTFFDDISTDQEFSTRLREVCERVSTRMGKLKATGRTVTVKIKYSDFKVNTRSLTVPSEVHDYESLYSVGDQLLHTPALPERPVRLLGISISNLSFPDDTDPEEQLNLHFDSDVD
ncbi:MAG: DNA polymerase IV [Rhodothermales bacterium]|nr:DNA polymerase IV [Rhodothermales bacterium]